jgi:hypothetical protein
MERFGPYERIKALKYDTNTLYYEGNFSCNVSSAAHKLFFCGGGGLPSGVAEFIILVGVPRGCFYL